MTQVSSEKLMSLVTLIVPDGSDGKPIANHEDCQEKLFIFLHQHNLDYHPIGDNKYQVRLLNEFEKHLYQSMFLCFGKGKVDGKKRLHPSVRIKIT